MQEEEIIRRAQTAIRRFDSLRIVGPGWSGNARQGFQFNPASGLAGAAGGNPPTPTPTGACCPEIGDCFITTQTVCEGVGGIYQGDDTTCIPDPCAGCCPPEPTFITGAVSFNYTGNDGVSGNREINGSGTFVGPLPYFNFTGTTSITGTDCCDDFCFDLSEVVPQIGAIASCDDGIGWTITLSVVFSSFCGFQVSFTKTYLYSDCASGGTGSFSTDLDVSGGSGFGTGACHIDYSLS